MGRPHNRMRRRSICTADIIIVVGLIALFTPLVWSLRSTILQYQAASFPAQTDEPATEDIRANEFAPSPAFSMSRQRIIIPKLGCNAVIVEETRDSDLDRGPMHLTGTAFPGDIGNCCIAAHKEKWFKSLDELRPGDTVTINDSYTTYYYRVITQRIVKDTELSVLDDCSDPTLTLITCSGPAYFGRGQGRIIVKATLAATQDVTAPNNTH